MPIFDFQAPDGTVHSIEGPEGATREQAWSKLQEHLASGDSQDAPEKTGSTLGGIAKSVPSGLVRGLADTAGTVTDFFHDTYGDKNTPNPIGKEALDAKVDPYLHKPQGTAEEIAAAAGANLPFAAFGPEGLAARVGYNAVLPAAAGVLAEKATGSPLAAAGAALATPLAARGIVGGVNALRGARAAAAAEPDLGAYGSAVRQSGGEDFNAARKMGVVSNPEAIDNVVGNMRGRLSGYDQDPAYNPAMRHIDSLEKLAEGTPTLLADGKTTMVVRPNVDMNDVETIRQRLSKLRTSPDASIRTAAQEAHDELTKWQMNLKPSDVVQGDADLYSQTMRDAVRKWGEGRRAELIAGKINLADLKTANKGTGADADNTTRQVFTALARPINNTNVPVWKKMGYSDAQGAIIESIAKGSPYGNMMRWFGKAAPTGIVSGAGGVGLGHMVGGPVGAFVLPAVGAIAKKLGDMDTQSRVKALDSLIRSGSKLAPGVAQQLGPGVVSQLSPAAQNALRSATNPRSAFQQARQAAGNAHKGYKAAKQSQKP